MPFAAVHCTHNVGVPKSINIHADRYQHVDMTKVNLPFTQHGVLVFSIDHTVREQIVRTLEHVERHGADSFTFDRDISPHRNQMHKSLTT